MRVFTVGIEHADVAPVQCSHAAYWSSIAERNEPEAAFHCRDYALHLRTIAEGLRLNMVERDLQIRPGCGLRS